MNWDRIEGNWQQLGGRVAEQWGKLNEGDFKRVAGRREVLVGKIQERYGVPKEEGEAQIAAWQGSATDDWFKPGQ